MQNLIKFNDFIFDMILEKIEDGELPFVLSDKLEELLNELEHKISHKLLDDNADKKYSKFTLVDIDDDNPDKFTFTNSSKIIQYYIDNDIEKPIDIKKLFSYSSNIKKSNIWNSNRSSIKIGRFINKLYPNEFPPNGVPGEDIESFVELIKTERTKLLGNFKIVDGDDIIKYYNESSYASNIGGSVLKTSCMAYDRCSPYINFYKENKNVKLIILMSEDEDDKIIGRALLWDLYKIDDEEVDRKFMDRVYHTKYSDVGKFINLAKNNNWLYKAEQSYDTNIPVCDQDECTIRELLVKVDPNYHGPYPYMDTFKFYDKEDNILSNYFIDNSLRLENTSGGYDDSYGEEFIWSEKRDGFIGIEDMYWSDVEDTYLDPSDAVWVSSLSTYVSQNYADENLIYSDIENEWIESKDSVHIEGEGFATLDYAFDNYAHCGYDGKFYNYDDSVPSEKWGAVPADKAVKVYTSTDIDWDNDDEFTFDVGSFADWRYEDDGSYFKIKNDNGEEFYFSNEFKNKIDIDEVKDIINKKED